MNECKMGQEALLKHMDVKFREILKLQRKKYKYSGEKQKYMQNVQAYQVYTSFTDLATTNSLFIAQLFDVFMGFKSH